MPGRNPTLAFACLTFLLAFPLRVRGGGARPGDSRVLDSLIEADRLTAGETPDYVAALQKLDAAAALLAPGDPEAPQIHNRRARVLIELGRFPQAEEAAERSVRDKPNALGYLRLAMARLYAGRYPQALESAGRAAGLYRLAPESRKELALAYEVSGCARWRLADPAAGEDFRAAGEADPQRAGRVEEWRADRLFCCLPDRDARKVYALSAEAAGLLGGEGKGERERRSRREAAAEKLGEALELVRGRIEAHHLHNLRARVYNLLDMPEESYAEAAESLRVKPAANPAAYFEASSARLRAAGRAKGGAGDYEIALQNALNGIGQARSGIGGPGLLARLYRVGGCARLGLGRADEARADFMRMAETDPSTKQGLEAFASGRPPCEDRGRPAEPSALLPFLHALGTLLGVALLCAAGAWVWKRLRAAADARAQIRVRAVAKREERRLAGRYEVVQVIGRGGMGEVYEGIDHSLGRVVAIKRMSAELARLGRRGREFFLKEARTVAALRHSSIVEIYAVFEEEGALYIVFELVRGKTVQQLLVEERRLPLVRVLEILRPVCEALAYAHAKQLVHRDLKPANIMVTQEGAIKLMDFGIARSLLDGAVRASAEEGAAGAPAAALSARTETVVGTPTYMSPEAGQGIVSREGDVYSLGVVLYEMLVGCPPFQGPSAAEEKTAMRFTPACARVRDLPPRVDELIREALQPSPERRLQSAADFLARLEDAAH